MLRKILQAIALKFAFYLSNDYRLIQFGNYLALVSPDGEYADSITLETFIDVEPFLDLQPFVTGSDIEYKLK